MWRDVVIAGTSAGGVEAKRPPIAGRGSRRRQAERPQAADLLLREHLPRGALREETGT